MTSDKGRSRSGARWGWLLTTLALGIALGVASWANYRSARDAVSTIDLGQIGVFEQVVMNAFRGIDPGAPQSLDSLVAAYADAGLRFVGMISPEEGLIVLEGPPWRIPWSHPHSKAPPRPIGAGIGFEPSSRPPTSGGGSLTSGPPAPGPPGSTEPLGARPRVRASGGGPTP